MEKKKMEGIRPYKNVKQRSEGLGNSLEDGTKNVSGALKKEKKELIKKKEELDKKKSRKCLA